MIAMDAATQQAIVETANRLGIQPNDLFNAMRYETNYTMNPNIKGGDRNAFQGLIQFGPTERKAYGYQPGMSAAAQIRGPVYNYLAARGVKPGMGLLDLYSTINAGSPGHYNFKDASGKTVAQHVAAIKANYAPLGPTPPLNVGQTAQGKQMPLGMGGGKISRGPAVSALQQQLAAAGFDPGSPDGIFGPKTAAAVRQAESKYGLTVDKGVAGPQVLGTLANQGRTNDILGLPPAVGPSATAPMSPTQYAMGGVPSPDSARRYATNDGRDFSAAAPWSSPSAAQSGAPADNPLNIGPRISTASRIPQEPMSAPGGPVAFTPHSLAPYTTAAAGRTGEAVRPSDAPVTSAFPGRPSLPSPNGVPIGSASPRDLALSEMGADTIPRFTEPPASSPSGYVSTRGGPVSPPGGLSKSEFGTRFDPQSPDFTGRLGNDIGGFASDIAKAFGNPGETISNAGAAVFGPGGPVQDASSWVRQQLGIDPMPAAPAAPSQNIYQRTPPAVPSPYGVPSDITPYSPPPSMAPQAYYPPSSGSLVGLPQTASLDNSFVPGSPVIGKPSPAFTSEANPPAVAPWGSMPGEVVGSWPSVAPSFGPALAYTPPPPVSINGNPADQAKKAVSDALRAAPVTGAGQSMGNLGNYGSVAPNQTYGGATGMTPWGSATYTMPGGGFSNSPFTPSGYTAPNFNPISGGATYAYQPNGYGGGTYITSNGTTMSY